LAPAISGLPIWHLLVFASACLFFGDVLNRRVSLPWRRLLAGLATLLQRLLRRNPAEATPEPLARLQNRKQQIAETIRQRQASVRFAPSVEPTAEPLARDAFPTPPAESQPAESAPAEAAPTDAPPADLGPSYSERLLQAKRAAQRQFGERNR
jgi:hypothetical protein